VEPPHQTPQFPCRLSSCKTFKKHPFTGRFFGFSSHGLDLWLEASCCICVLNKLKSLDIPLTTSPL
jgi:hypothetical protein